MKQYSGVRHKQVMRTKLIGELKKVMPHEAQILVNAMSEECKKSGRCFVNFTMQGLPMSVNHMYDRIGYKKSSGQNGVITKRKPEVDKFRLELMQAMAEKRFDWKPTGCYAAVILFESAHWLTLERKVHQMDADNRVKVLLDAIEIATDVPDELCWQVHLFKVASKRTRTTVYLFDLGDVVEYYY